jgi:thiamine pyrophosphokinase
MLTTVLNQLYSLKNYSVIVANGLFPHSKELINILYNADKIFCCDGAINNLLKYTIQPDYIIGDCDSLSKEIKQYFANKIIEISDQSSNDLSKAFNFAINNFALTNLIILGATGLREDHTLANLSLLPEFSHKIKQTAIISDFGIITAHHHDVCLDTIIGQQISFFTFNPDTRITCAELKWPLNNFSANLWYFGTLNQATTTQINVKINNHCLIFRAFEIKS